MTYMILAFVGKGGVGKTTVSSAVALNLSNIGPTAIVSSDFMSSLRHVFPEDPKNLSVIELKEREVAENWKQKYGTEVMAVLDDFVEVDQWMIDHIAYSPGVAEEFMISNIVDLDKSRKYDYVVWDTAASSSTMHLLFLEKEFYGHLDRDVQILVRIKDRFRSSKTYRILQEWKELANNVWNALLGTEFFTVSTMDELSLIQADEITKDLKSMGLAARGEIFNRVKVRNAGSLHGVGELPEVDGNAIEVVHKLQGELLGFTDRFIRQEKTQNTSF